MKLISRWFMNGLLTFLSISITIWIVWWVLSFADKVFGTPIRQYFGIGGQSGYYFYGIGILAMIVILVGLGFCLEFYLGKLFLSWGERIMDTIPGIKIIYSSLKEVIAFFKPDKSRGAGNYMVTVTIAENLKFLGYVTREGIDIVNNEVVGVDEVVVILPFCYQMGGNTLIVPKHMVKRLDIGFEEGMKLALTGFVIPSKGESRTRRLPEQK
jgi:uncharacterized membrane protein